MARLRRDARLESRDARLRLPPSPDNTAYWRGIERGLALGYYKGPQGGAWYVRRRLGSKYIKARLALADDFSDSNGTTILSFAEAQRKALGTSEALKPRSERRYTVSQAVADYLEHLKVRAKSWRDTEIKLNAHVLPKLGTYQLVELTPEILRRWRDGLARTTHDRGRRRTRRSSVGQGTPEAPAVEAADGTEAGVAASSADLLRRKQATSNRIFAALRACLNHAWRDGKTDSDQAWHRVPAFRNVDSPVVRFVTRDEAVRLINASVPEFRPLVRAALLTGCRYGELCALEVGDYDPDNETLVIRYSKSGKARHVYLTSEGVDLFEGLVTGRPREALMFLHEDGSAWGPSHQHRPMREACTHAEIHPPISFHILRHSYASLLTKAGVPLQVVASALGHADARMTEKHYAHLAPSHVAQLIRDNLPQLSDARPKRGRKVTRLRV
jgi:integrase